MCCENVEVRLLFHGICLVGGACRPLRSWTEQKLNRLESVIRRRFVPSLFQVFYGLSENGGLQDFQRFDRHAASCGLPSGRGNAMCGAVASRTGRPNTQCGYSL